MDVDAEESICSTEIRIIYILYTKMQEVQNIWGQPNVFVDKSLIFRMIVQDFIVGEAGSLAQWLITAEYWGRTNIHNQF